MIWPRSVSSHPCDDLLNAKPAAFDRCSGFFVGRGCSRFRQGLASRDASLHGFKAILNILTLQTNEPLLVVLAVVIAVVVV